MDLSLLGVCGLYCGACNHYHASLPEGAHLLSEEARQGRPLEGYTCRGCRSGRLYLHAGCSDCGLRVCAETKSLQHCGLCPELPCPALCAFQGDGRIHHREVLGNLAELKAIGADRWLAGQDRRWTCRCGRGYSWYEKTCSGCGSPLRSYGG